MKELLSSWVGIGIAGGLFTASVLAVSVTAVYELSGSATRAVVMIFLINLLVVLGLQVFTGNSGVVSFGALGFMAIGAYTSALLSTPPTVKVLQIPDAPAFVRHASWNFLYSTLAAVVLTMAVALPFGVVFARLRGAAAAIATLAWFIIVLTIIGNWSSLTAGTATLYGIPATTTVWWGLGWSAVAIIVGRLFRESPSGLGLRASSVDELVAQAVGVNLLRARVFAWTLGAGMAAVAGALYAHFILALAPSVFEFSQAFLLVVMVIIGGRSVSGAVTGTAVVSVLQEGLRRGENATGWFGLSMLVLASLFLAMILWRPSGLLGRWEIDELVLRASRSRGQPGSAFGDQTRTPSEPLEKGGKIVAAQTDASDCQRPTSWQKSTSRSAD